MNTIDGKNITIQEIEIAVRDGRAVIHWARGNWINLGGLAIYATAEIAEMEAERDTRGGCYSMADEVWSHIANKRDAIRAARGLLKKG